METGEARMGLVFCVTPTVQESREERTKRSYWTIHQRGRPAKNTTAACWFLNLFPNVLMSLGSFIPF